MIFGNTDYNTLIKNVQETLAKLPTKHRVSALVVLSDLSMNLETADKLFNLLFTFYGFSPNQVLVIDHHETTEAAAKKYPSIHLDISKSATLLVQEALTKGELAKHAQVKAQYQRFAERVNAYDLHLTHEAEYHRGLYLSDQLLDFTRLVPTPLGDLKRDWAFTLLDALNAKFESQYSLRALDIWHTELLEMCITPSLPIDRLEDPDQSILQKIYQALAQEVIKLRLFETFQLGGLNIALMQNYGNVFYAIVDDVLNAFSDIDACMHVNQRGNISLRSHEPIKVNVLSEMYFSGGGHPCAAGGKLPDSFDLRKPLLPQLKTLDQ